MKKSLPSSESLHWITKQSVNYYNMTFNNLPNSRIERKENDNFLLTPYTVIQELTIRSFCCHTDGHQTVILQEHFRPWLHWSKNYYTPKYTQFNAVTSKKQNIDSKSQHNLKTAWICKPRHIYHYNHTIT